MIPDRDFAIVAPILKALDLPTDQRAGMYETLQYIKQAIAHLKQERNRYKREVQEVIRRSDMQLL